MRSLCIRSCAFTEIQASEAVIEGPVDISRSRSTQLPQGGVPGTCWVVFAGARIEGRIDAAHGSFAAPKKREANKWVLYSKHSRYALDLRGTHISGSVNLRPSVTAWGGICLTLAKVDGSVWANGAALEGVEDSAFAADYAEIQGSCYFRPYDPLRTESERDKGNTPVPESVVFTTKGCMSLFAAKIGGSLFFEGAKLVAIDPENRDTRSERNAVLNTGTAVIGGYCLCRSWISEHAPEENDKHIEPKLVSHFIGDGAILLAAASIGNDLDFSGARVRSIHADNIKISGNCKLTTYSMTKVKDRQPFQALYAVHFEGAVVRGNFILDEARIGSFALNVPSLEKITPEHPLIDPSLMEDLSDSCSNLWTYGEAGQDAGNISTSRNGVFASGINIGGKCCMGVSDDKGTVFGFECIGKIRMQEAKLNNSLRMDGAWVIGPDEKTTIDLSGISVGGKATFMTWDKNPSIEGKVFRLRGGETGIKLTGAHIGQELLMNGAQIRAGKTAFVAENVYIGGKASLGTYEKHGTHSSFRFRSWGKVSLVSASIKLGLDMSGAELNGIVSQDPNGTIMKGEALDLTRLRAKYVRLCRPLCIDGAKHASDLRFSANGRVSLEHSSIDTYLTFDGSRFDRQLNAEYAQVGGAVELINISLTSGYARENIREEDARTAFNQRSALPDLSLRGIEIEGPLKVHDVQLLQPSSWKPGEPCKHFTVDLRGARTGVLDDQGGNGWGPDLRMWLEGFRYFRLPDSDNVKPLERPGFLNPHRIFDPSWLPDQPHIHESAAGAKEKRGNLWRHRALWLRLQYFDYRKMGADEFSPDAYEQVVKGMNETGSYEDARHIAGIRLTLDAKNKPLMPSFLYTPFRIFFDYGFSVNRALATFVFCLLLGTCAAYIANYERPFGTDRVLILNTGAPDSKLVFTKAAGNIKEKTEIKPIQKDDHDNLGEENTPCGDHVESFLYALDVFIPVLDLRQQDACSIAPGERLWKIAQASYAILGWIITSLVVLTCSGLLRRHLER